VPDANVDLYYLTADTTLDIRVSSADTLFAFFRGTEYENFRLDATKQGFTRGTGTTSTVGLGPDNDTVYVDLYLRQIDTGVIVLRNLYFDLDECYIRSDAVPSLDTVYQILMRNPNIQIELGSHTDSRNTHEYNEKLSQCRADSSKAWLVKRGIPEQRIVAVGYGERKLLNECADGVQCSNIKHQVNRRTEFRVIGEIPGAIVKYDDSEVKAAMQNTGTSAINQTLWNFEEAPDQPQEEPQER
jgi:outer membrane protein OmpA-like peptidoglycan-associated protein